MIRSFRLRLTAFYLAFFTLLFAVFSLSLYGVLAGGLRDRLDQTLVSEANTAAGMFLDEFQEVRGDVQIAANEAVAGMKLRAGLIAVFSGERLIAAAKGTAASDFARLLSQAAAHPEDVTLALPRMGRHGARAATHRVTAGGKDYLIVAAEPLDAIAGELSVVRRTIFVMLPLILLIAGVGGYLLATRTLAPLNSMAEQARRITDANLDTRIDIGAAADELAALVSTFNELLARLDQSFETMRRFVADASHELRTPLSVIRGEADIALSHDRDSAEYKESLTVILDESRRLSRLVDDLLNLARADAGRVTLQVSEFYLNELLTHCCRSVEALAGQRGIALECLVGTDVQFRGDEELLRRLVINLLENAIRYTPPGGRISVALEADPNAVLVRVSDTGAGISPEAVPHVFERVYRGDKARTRRDGGFGLGLSIVKWIAESHHGTVDLTSELGAGTTLSVTLPR